MIPDDQIKVSYIRGEDLIPGNPFGAQGSAYVSQATLFGTDKYTDVEVQLEWSDEYDAHIQIDTWQWDFDREGTPTKRVEP